MGAESIYRLTPAVIGVNVLLCCDVVMTAARSTPVPVTLAGAASWPRPATAPTERQASPTAATVTVPATATVRQAQSRCIEAAEHLPVQLTTAATWVAVAAEAECLVRAGSATTAVPSSRRRAPSSVANAAWRATRDVTAVTWPPWRHAHGQNVTLSASAFHCDLNWNAIVRPKHCLTRWIPSASLSTCRIRWSEKNALLFVNKWQTHTRSCNRKLDHLSVDCFCGIHLYLQQITDTFRERHYLAVLFIAFAWY